MGWWNTKKAFVLYADSTENVPTGFLRSEQSTGEHCSNALVSSWNSSIFNCWDKQESPRSVK